jgi:hypothetical protein
MQLCEQAAVEHDPGRLLEINQMLEEKEQRLERKRSDRGGI